MIGSYKKGKFGYRDTHIGKEDDVKTRREVTPISQETS